MIPFTFMKKMKLPDKLIGVKISCNYMATLSCLSGVHQISQGDMELWEKCARKICLGQQKAKPDLKKRKLEYKQKKTGCKNERNCSAKNVWEK